MTPTTPKSYHLAMAKNTITTILFDLDGTLLPMDQDQFMMGYFDLFTKRCVRLGFDAQLSGKALFAGVGAMIANNGSMTNEERFYQVFFQVSGIDRDTFMRGFATFYQDEFNKLIATTHPDGHARELVQGVLDKGYQAILATSPLFPKEGTASRLAWAGLDDELFSMVTTYEGFGYVKPHLGYYDQVLQSIDALPSECLMVGNDATEDMAAARLGMQVYLVTDCLINKKGESVSAFPNGSLHDLAAYLKTLPSLAK